MARIQTSKITTLTDGDLAIEPNGLGKLVFPKLSGGGEIPVGVDTNGNVKPLDERAFAQLTTVDPGDYVMIQRGADYYYFDASELGAFSLANPSPDQVTWSPNTPSGSGTQGDPFVLTPVTVNAPGGQATSVEQLNVTGQFANSLLLIEEIGGTSGIRFNQTSKVTDANGDINGIQFTYADVPASSTGQNYTGLIKLGNSSVYVRWEVTQAASRTQFSPASSPTASPTKVRFAEDSKYGTVSGIWADGLHTLKATNMVFGVNGGVLDESSKQVNDSDTIEIGFIDATVAAASEGDTITGVLESEDGTYYHQISMVKNTVPAPFSIGSVTDADVSTEASTRAEQLKGFNAPTLITAGGSGSNALANFKVSINGDAPITVNNTTLNPGESIQGYGTTGGNSATIYEGTFTVGGENATLEVMTSDSNPAITRPIITSPISGSVNIVPDVTLVGGSYTAVNSAGPHTSSTWEVYEAVSTTENPGPPTTEPPDPAIYTFVVSSADDTTNLTSYKLTDLVLEAGKFYYSRVRYKDDGSTGPTIESDFSEWQGLATKASFIPSPGDSLGGGYFVAQINDAGAIYNVIVAPTETNTGLQGQHGGRVPLPIYWGKEEVGSTTNQVWGAPATAANVDRSSATALQWVTGDLRGPNAGVYDVTNSTGSGIGGFNDWYVPATNELELCYRHLKPGTEENDVLSGENPNAVPTSSNYSPSDPVQTAAANFKVEEDQAFDSEAIYWTSTSTETKSIDVISFDTGRLAKDLPATGSHYLRAIRREAA